MTSTKYQVIPNNSNAPNSKQKKSVLIIWYWVMEFIWDLKFGIWNFNPVRSGYAGFGEMRFR
jgi:hypothetical protein